MHYYNTVQEHSPVVCFTKSSGEQGLQVSGVERRVGLDNAATDGGRWRSVSSDDAGKGDGGGRGGQVQPGAEA